MIDPTTAGICLSGPRLSKAVHSSHFLGMGQTKRRPPGYPAKAAMIAIPCQASQRSPYGYRPGDLTR